MLSSHGFVWPKPNNRCVGDLGARLSMSSTQSLPWSVCLPPQVSCQLVIGDVYSTGQLSIRGPQSMGHIRTGQLACHSGSVLQYIRPSHKYRKWRCLNVFSPMKQCIFQYNFARPSIYVVVNGTCVVLSNYSPAKYVCN